MNTTTTERDALLADCAAEDYRHATPIRAAAEALRGDFALYDEVIDLIESGINNAYTTIVAERAAPADEFGPLFRGSIGGFLATGERSEAAVAFFDRHGIRG